MDLDGRENIVGHTDRHESLTWGVSEWKCGETVRRKPSVNRLHPRPGHRVWLVSNSPTYPPCSGRQCPLGVHLPR